MQAITTKHVGPTSSRGSRIIARCAAGSLTVDYEYALNIEENHALAASALIVKLGWKGETVSGCDHKGNYVHVFVK